MSKTLVVESQLARFQTLADGSVRLIFDCGEQPQETFGEIGALNKKTGILVFKGDVENLSSDELKAIEAFETKGMVKADPRSKSQKLRASLWHFFNDQKQAGDPEISKYEKFDEFYSVTMDKIIRYYGGGYKNS